MKPDEKWKLLELWERARDGKTSNDETRELNERIKSDANVRQFIAEAVFLEAELRIEGEESFKVQDLTEQTKPVAASWIVPRMFATAAAAAIVAGGAMWLLEREPAPVATLVKAQQCKWGNSALPTLEGGLLRAGTLELLEGMATLKFNSGAEVVMEAPVSLEVVNAMECRIKRGTVVADVPPEAKGFTVQTPDTKVVDYGTRFGVSTSEDGKCLVHVIKGLVEVNRKDPGETRKLTTGERADFGGMVKSQVSGTAANNDQPEPDRWLPGPISDMGDGWQMLTTAFGRGKDTCIQSNPGIKITGAEPFFRVKHTTLDAKLERKGYLAFDLSRFAGKDVVDAEFVLHVEPSDLGFASLVPEATFAVYGLTNEAEDEWAEDGVNWESAPAHDSSAPDTAIPTSAARLLGHFAIPQGTTRGSFSIKGDDLARFLRSDTNGLVTLIVCRETDETARNGLVHAFATKENARNTPPILRLKTGG